MGICTIISLTDRLRSSVIRYYALSATCALFKHVENKLSMRFSPASLRIRYVQVDGTMMIDSETARNLELVGSMSHKRSTYSLLGYELLVVYGEHIDLLVTSGL